MQLRAGTIQLGAGGMQINAAITVTNAGSNPTLSGAGGVTVNLGNGGTVTFNCTNAYTGETVIASGTMTLGARGGIPNSSRIFVSDSATFNVAPKTAGFILGAGQTLAGNGTVIGSVIAQGTLSPGDSVGSLTHSGALLLQGNGTNVVEVMDAAGVAGAGYDLLSVSGNLGVQSTSGNPFTIKLVSLNGGGSPGAAVNFNNDTNYTWTIAAGTVTNFAADKFRVDATAFSNDLAGGEFVIGASPLTVRFTNNHAPTTALATFSCNANVPVLINIADLLAASTGDPDGDAREWIAVDAVSTNGMTVTSDGTYIYYTNFNNVTDRFSYTVRDVRAAYRPGDTVRTASGTIEMQVVPATGAIYGKVQLQGFTGTGPRTVRFLASDRWGAALQTNDLSLTFLGSPKLADYSLSVPTDAAYVSAKTAWNLRRRQAVLFSAAAVATNDFTGVAGQLLGGDISQDNNLINTADYTLMKGNWLKTASNADLTGDGLVNTADYTILKGNWLKVGEPP